MFKKTIYKLIITAILAITSAGAYVYSVMYVGGMGSDLSSLYKESSDLSVQEESLNSVKRVAENADQRNAEISKYIVPVENEGAIKFLKLMENLAEQYKLKYITNSMEIVPDTSLSKINKEYLSINMSVSGPELVVFNFIKKMESIPFNTKVTSISLVRTSTGIMQNDVQASFSILVIKDK